MPEFISLISFQLAPTRATSLIEAMKLVKNPHLMCEKVYEGIKLLTAQISALCEKPEFDPNGEGWIKIDFSLLKITQEGKSMSHRLAPHQK